MAGARVEDEVKVSISRKLNPSELLHAAVVLVLTDEGFSIPTDPAREARKTAEKLLEWSSENKAAWYEFAHKLITSLLGCFETHTNLSRIKKQREKMWEKFHKMRSSESFTLDWDSFLTKKAAVCVEACPIFYQFITDSLMEELIKLRFPVAVIQSRTKEVSIDYQEKNGARYSAGYIIRSLKKKLARSARKNKEELMRSLDDMVEDSPEECTDESSDWTKSVDRGGLIHVSDIVYCVFESMELVIRRYFSTEMARTTGLLNVVDKILDDEDVLFAWSIVSASWVEEKLELLRLIAEQYVTMRGFSFASSIMERYKKRERKGVQKSKGVRKQLQTS